MNKPVAYGMLTFCKNCGEQNPYSVKKEYESFDRTASHMAGEYVAHPVKELTDEEIEECYWGDGYPDNPRHPKEFAYAILRKAQEK